MTGSGITPPGGNQEGSGKQPSWRRSTGASPSQEQPAPSGTPEPEGFGDATLMQPQKRPAAEAGADQPGKVVIGDHTMASQSAGDTTLSMPGNLPKIPGVVLSRELGRGGMGVVYEGKQGYLDRRVAVKFLGQGNQTTEFMRRFQREAKILASLNHPRVVGCYQAGVATDGRCFLVMEFIDGPTLGDWIDKHGALAHEHAVAVCRDMASALAFAHASGIIHRDVKPPNVLLKTRGGCAPDESFPYEPMLADLGLARASGELPTLVDITMQGLTAHGAVMGSPPTMAPEQFDAPDDVDFRTDIYGLGCVLFHCLTGKLAFPQGTLTKLISRKTSGKMPDPRELQRGVSPALAELVRDMLAPDPEDRPGSYDELLRRFEGPFEPAPRRRGRTLAYGAAGAVLLVGGWLAVGALGAEEEPVPEAAQEDETELARALGVDRSGAEEPEDDPDSQALGGSIRTPFEPEPELEDSGPGELASDETAGTDLHVEPVLQGAAVFGDTTGSLPIVRGSAEGAMPPDTGAGTDVGTDVPTDAPIGEPEPEPEPEPTLELPTDLPEIRAGETWELLDTAQHPLAGWSATVGDPAKWQAIDHKNGASANLFGERGGAERPLPAPAWLLSGQLELVRPTRVATRSLQLVIVLANGHGIMFQQAIDEDLVRLTGHRAVPRDGGGWVAGEEIPELACDAIDRAEYRAASPVAFQVSWDGELLSLAWGPSGAAEARTQLTADDLIELGAPIRLAIELEDGSARLREFVIEGR